MKFLSSNHLMIFLDLLMIVYSLWVINHRKYAELPSLKLAAIGLVVWLLGLHFVISNQLLLPTDIGGFSFYLVILAGVGLLGILLFGVSYLRKIILGLSQQELALLQGIRIFFGAGFIIQAATAELPLMFGIVDGITHISAGFFSLIAAYSVASNIDATRRLWFANLFGLADILIVATTLAFLLLPTIGPHHPMMYAVFLPAPFWLWFHLVSIQNLLRDSN